MSFDVESLFTNVPVEGAVQAALRKLESDADLAERTTDNGSVYEQQDGVASL